MPSDEQREMSENETGSVESGPIDREMRVSSAAALQAALDHWTQILQDDEASDTAKMNAANGLARFGRAELAGHGGQIHQMSRDELQEEIQKVRKALDLS